MLSRKVGAGVISGTSNHASVIAQRLDHLFATVHPPGRGPYSLREAADAINEAAGTSLISTAYLSQLRLGHRSQPSHARLLAIARFFGVDIRYFSDDETARQTDEQLAVLAAMRDIGVRSVALRAAGLSQASLKTVQAVIDNVRQLEGLDEVPGEGEHDRRQDPTSA